MMRSKKAFLNTAVSLLLEFVTIINGFILPRLILTHFGSSYNGVTSSISQFISYVSLLSAGIGGVTRASLYKPLSIGNVNEVSGIVRATEIFFRKIAVFFTIGLLIFASTYPFLVISDFSWFFTFTLALILGMGTFIRYFFGTAYGMVLDADQRQYISLIIQIFTTIANTVIAAILIKSGATIHMVRLGSSIIFAVNPVFIHFYVRKKYKIIRNIEPNTDAIKQRWDAFSHQIANFVHGNTDLVILSFFSNVREISVYTVYYLVANGVTKVITSFSTGIEAAFGNMIAKNEMETLNRNLSIFEFLIYSTSIVLFTPMAILIISFISIYTKGITDADYYRPLFGYMIAFVQFFYCIRIPYQATARAAGHYRQTRNGAIAEAVLNIVISLLLVKRWGLIGITIGTLCAMIFRTIQYGLYVSQNIVYRKVKVIARRFIISGTNVISIIIIVRHLHLPQAHTYYGWFLNGLLVFTVSLVLTSGFGLLFYKEDINGLTRLINTILKRKID